MRVLVVHNDYGNPSGEEHALGAIEGLLTRNGHEVLQFRKSSATLHAAPTLPSLIAAFGAGIHSFRSAREMDGFLAANPVDVVHLQNVFPVISPSVLPVIKRHGIPIVMRCPNYRLFCPSGLHLRDGRVCTECVGGREWNCFRHNCEASLAKSLGYTLRSWWARTRRSFLDFVDLFVVLSEFQKRRFVEGGIPEERIRIVPNFSSMPKVESSNPPKVGRNISFVGRLAKEKGIEMFVRAAEQLPELQFAAAGSDRWFHETGRQVPPNMTLRGFLTGDALAEFYRESRVLCFPCQWYEGFPNTIILAMEHHKPVLASRIGALPEIVSNGETGLLHDPKSIDAMVEQISTLAADDAMCRKMGNAGYERLFTEYHETIVYERWMNVYQSVIEGGRAG